MRRKYRLLHSSNVQRNEMRTREKQANAGRPQWQQRQQQVHACMPHSFLYSFMSNVCVYYNFFSFASINRIENARSRRKTAHYLDMSVSANMQKSIAKNAKSLGKKRIRINLRR